MEKQIHAVPSSRYIATAMHGWSTFSRLLLIWWLVVSGTSLLAQDTQRLYLSGRDKDSAVPWHFMCTSGAQSGYWTNLAVPSHWDLNGFGTLTYKKDATNAWNERGLYRHEFNVPAEWEGMRVFLVFEGVMTDTTVTLNGESVGPTHQGGFYRFKYEVTGPLRMGGPNTLEVEVARHSSNESVNKAERLADYWVFAGIYRPVYLEAVPPRFIERVAIDARHDGTFSMEVFHNAGLPIGNAATQTVETPRPMILEAQIEALDGTEIGEAFSAEAAGSKTILSTTVLSPRQWTAETPHRYRVTVRLKQGEAVCHRYVQRFGFRTVEVRDGDGIYVNGRRVILKGVNRHSFWPDSGRCLSEAVHRLDIEAMKEMNMNAVRMSHYPPDVAFLDLCDELGLYVLDELAGWHNAYDDEVGRKLVEATVTRDVNHPSILFWDNGNEGGFNTNLDAVYLKFDPQQRRVLHPWEPFHGINTAHYLAYSNAQIAASGEPMYYQPKANDEVLNPNLPDGWIYMPTEFLHGLYDGGAGAGMEDYWRMMMGSPLLGGGFVWVFCDEGVKRPDTGEIDTAGNAAPDGIVGPYREREGSFYTLKELWSPIQVTWRGEGRLTIENHYDFTDAADCRFHWQLKRLPWPGEPESQADLLAEGQLSVPQLPPGERVSVPMEAAKGLQGNADLLSLRATDPTGRVLWTWTWPMPGLDARPEWTNRPSQAVRVENGDSESVELRSEDLRVHIRRDTGLLKSVQHKGRRFSLQNGPRPANGEFALKRLRVTTLGGVPAVVATYEGALRTVTWRLSDDGWLRCDYEYVASGLPPYAGVTFDYPETLVRSKRWLGEGPYRVWKNRLRGVTLGVWETTYNDTVTGYSEWDYPEFKGCFANVYWMEFGTDEGVLTLVPGRAGFVQVLNPQQPPERLRGNTGFELPDCGIGLLDAIPAVGSKFKPATTTGPQGQPNAVHGDSVGWVAFLFR